MDGRRFDEMTRGVGAAATRRRVVAAALGLASATVGGDAAAGGGGRRQICRPYGGGCTRNGQCCSANCMTSRQLPRKQRNRCGCAAGLAVCGGCVDLDTDQNHCGECDNACPFAQVCRDGECVCAGASETFCPDANVCADLDTDPDHCGACNESTDPDTQLCCDGTVTTLSNSNCGCGISCDTDDWEACYEGSCVEVCVPFASGYGFVTNDEVTRFFPGNNSSFSKFAEANGRSGSDLIHCDTSADCDAYVCPTQVEYSSQMRQVSGCGCLKARCLPSNRVDFFGWMQADTYTCAAVFSDQN